MACMSLATDMVAAYLAAETAVLLGKSVTVEGRIYASEDLAAIRKGRQEWEARVAAEQAAAAGKQTLGGLSFSHARLR